MMPPPTMTARAADGTEPIDPSEVLQTLMGALETPEIIIGIRDIVKIERRVVLRHHAPHGLAQQRRALHGVIAAPKFRRERSLEIGFEQPFLLDLRELVVGAEVAEVEQRAVEAGIVPVDQPQTAPVVDEVRRQQVVVAEYEIDGADHGLEIVRDFKQARQGRDHAPIPVGQGLCVAAEDLEYPKNQRRPAEMPGHLTMAPLQERQNAPQIGWLAYVSGGERLAVDILEDDSARFGVQNSRRQARCGRRPTGSKFMKAKDPMHHDVVADADEMTTAAIGYDEVCVGDAALQRFWRDRAGPVGKSGCPRARIDAVHDGHASPNRSFTRRLHALISRSAMMPMKAVHRPATIPRPGSAF